MSIGDTSSFACRLKGSDIRKELLHTIRLGWPIIGAQLLVQSMVFVDNLIVGILGKHELAALAAAAGFYSLTKIIAIGSIGIIPAFIAQAAASKDPDQSPHHIVKQSMYFAGLLIIAVWIMLSFLEPAMHLFNQDPALIPLAQEYIQGMMWAVPGQMILINLRNVVESHEDSMASMIAMAIAAGLNIPLDYALVIGWGPFPAMGISGAAYATAILSWAAAAGLFGYTMFSRGTYRKIWSGSWRPDFAIIKKFIVHGVPLGGAISVEMSFFVATTFIMGTISTTALAAHQIALNAASIVFMIPLGLSFAVSIRVGKHRGANDSSGMRRAWLSGVIIVLVSQTLTGILFFTQRDLIVSLYSQTGEVAVLGATLLFVAAFFQMFDGLQAVGLGALRGIHDGRFALLATVLSFWLLGGLTICYFYIYDSKNPIGVWVGLLVGLGCASICHHTRMYLATKH